MNILITNDDGISSSGLYSLVKQFIDKGSILVCAPDRQRSASSHSITMHNPVSASKFDFYGLNCRAYAISGTPVDCVKLGCEKLSDGNIDIVISGINDGGNLGTDVIYSGTVSAAIEGAMLGIPSIAISLTGYGPNRDFSTASKYARIIFDKFLFSDFTHGTILNVNVPPCSNEEIKGIIATCLGTRKYVNNYEERKDPRGNTYYWLAGDIVKVENGSTTDINAIENNYVSITPMHFELTKFDYIDGINNWFREA